MASSVPSSAITILLPGKAALSPTLAKHHVFLLRFAANEDGAEKGLSGSSIELDRMRKSGKNKGKVTSGAQQTEVAASTGIDLHLDTREDNTADEKLLASSSLPESRTETGSSRSESQSKGNGSESESKNGDQPPVVDNGFDRFINRSYVTYPDGTPRLAAFQSEANSLAIWRRFSRVHCRLLLRLQSRINDLEKKLDMLDEKDAGTDMEYRLARNDWDKDWDRTQEDLLDELQMKILQFDDLLLKDSQLRRLARTPARDHQTLFNWIYGTKPLYDGHYDFIFHHDDFVTSSDLAKEVNAFDRFIESCLNRWPTSIFNYFMRNGEIQDDPQVRFFSRARIILISKLLALCTVISILLIPIFLFTLMTLSRKMESVIVLLFVLAFAIILSLFTAASVESMFIGTCTYAAVLITFLGNVQAGASAAAGAGSSR